MKTRDLRGIWRAVVAAAAIVTVGGGMRAAAGAAQESRAGSASEGYYTEAQAARGKVLWDKHCSSCHSADLVPPPPGTPVRGFKTGSRTVPSNLGGKYIVSKQVEGRPIYRNAYYLFRELESMPSDTDSITAQQRTDILAFLLQANGFATGPAELKPDTRAMKLLSLDEPGFERLFNGRDFSGWKFLIGLGCTPPPQGCGRVDPGSNYVIRDGTVLASKNHGLMYTAKTYLNFTLRFDFLPEAPADWAGEEDIFYYANTGTILFLTDQNLQIIPKSLAIAGELREVGKPIALDSTIKATYDLEARKKAMRPLGNWNAVEIVSKNGTVTAFLNGVQTTTISQHEFKEPGHIGLQVQGYPIRWRNIRIKAE